MAMKNKTNSKIKPFNVPLYFWWNVFGKTREMPECVNASLFLELWVVFVEIATFSWPSFVTWPKEGKLSRCFIESAHEWMKTYFMTNKAASSYISILFIVCCFLVTAPNKQKCVMSRTLPMVYFQSVSRYRDLFTTETKELSWYMATFPFVLIAWLMIWEYQMKYSNFFRSGLHGV